MKERIVRTLFFTLISISAVLLLVMLWLNIFHFNTAGVYSVSVLVRTPGDRFTKGMEQAALDYNADLYIISSFNANDGAQQIEYLKRELENYADAVILNPEDPGSMEKYLEGNRPRAPVVTVISEPDEGAKVILRMPAISNDEKGAEL